MAPKTDDKLVQSPPGQAPEKQQDNVVPLMPRLRDKKRDRAANPPPERDNDDPGPSAA
jgi:hypothetical protein